MKVLALVIFVSLFHAGQAIAVPLLSEDGSILTGLSVNGRLYDVMFGDGIVGEVYEGIVFDDDREREANAVSSALLSYLQTTSRTGLSIAGCVATDRRDRCILFNPDLEYSSNDHVADAQYVEYLYSEWIQWPDIVLAPRTLDTGDEFRSTVTLVTYALQPTAPVSVPVPLVLILLGLSILQGLRHADCTKRGKGY
jgi:hypothetical protein